MDFAPLKIISLKHDTIDHPPLFLNNCPIAEVSSLKILGFVFDSSFTWGPHVDMIVSRAKQRLAQLCRLSPILDPAGLSVMYKSFIRSCLEYGHLLYFSAARSHLERLDALQRRAAGICHDDFPSLESRRCAAVVGLTVGYWMVRVVVICSQFVLPLSLILLGDLPALMICQILPEQVDYIILLHFDLWTVFAEVGML